MRKAWMLVAVVVCLASATSADAATVGTPGAFCSPAGADGVSRTGQVLLCVARADGRARWKTLPLRPLVIAPASHEGSYARPLFGSGWIDADRDCQNTRVEVLIAESVTPVRLTPSGCSVAAGTWDDPWSANVITTPRALDVDHMVPLANAWRSGAWSWDRARRIAYANDLAQADHLVAIPASTNRAKADSGPEEWRPDDATTWCAYARAWNGVKLRWSLTATAAEWQALLQMATSC